jgi:hypothetical protein
MSIQKMNATTADQITNIIMRELNSVKKQNVRSNDVAGPVDQIHEWGEIAKQNNLAGPVDKMREIMGVPRKNQSKEELVQRIFRLQEEISHEKDKSLSHLHDLVQLRHQINILQKDKYIQQQHLESMKSHTPKEVEYIKTNCMKDLQNMLHHISLIQDIIQNEKPMTMHQQLNKTSIVDHLVMDLYNRLRGDRQLSKEAQSWPLDKERDIVLGRGRGD